MYLLNTYTYIFIRTYRDVIIFLSRSFFVKRARGSRLRGPIDLGLIAFESIGGGNYIDTDSIPVPAHAVRMRSRVEDTY